MTTYLAIESRLADRLRSQLLAPSPLESGAFCLLHHVQVGGQSRLVLGDVIETTASFDEQSEALLTPSGRSISQAVSCANADEAGLAFIHTHPLSIATWPGLSAIDRKTSRRLGDVMIDLIDGDFASLVLSQNGVGGVVVKKDALEPLERIAVVGRRIETFSKHSAKTDPELDDRQVRAIGTSGQSQLSRLRVAVIGAGGLGSPITETLVRMGVGEIQLVDFDELDTPSNARRIFGIGANDVDKDTPRFKATAVAEGLNRLGLHSTIDVLLGDVREDSVRGQLLNADLIVCGTDNHSSRAALTELSVRASLPLIDVGVRVGIRDGEQLDSLLFERRVQVPDGPCLWCWGRLDAERIRAEMLEEQERSDLTAEGYLTGSNAEPAPSVAALTVTAAGAATSAVLGMVAGGFDVAPLAVRVDSLTLDAAPLALSEPDPECVCAAWRRAAARV